MANTTTHLIPPQLGVPAASHAPPLPSPPHSSPAPGRGGERFDGPVQQQLHATTAPWKALVGTADRHLLRTSPMAPSRLLAKALLLVLWGLLMAHEQALGGAAAYDPLQPPTVPDSTGWPPSAPEYVGEGSILR